MTDTTTIGTPAVTAPKARRKASKPTPKATPTNPAQDALNALQAIYDLGINVQVSRADFDKVLQRTGAETHPVTKEG